MADEFDIDDYINPYIPAPRLNRLPYLISHSLGYRPKGYKKDINPWFRLLWIFICTFVGLLAVMLTFNYSTYFENKGVPVMIPSLGASAVLLYNIVDNPSAQPRNFLCGTTISSFVGICIMKFFTIHPSGVKYLWLGAGLATSCSSIVMTLLNCLHPPAAAASMLPLLDNDIMKLGWYYIPVQLLAMIEMLFVACIMTNMFMLYPLHWWTSKPLARKKHKMSDQEDDSQKNEMSNQEREKAANAADVTGEEERVVNSSRCENKDSDGQHSIKNNLCVTKDETSIVISAHDLTIPQNFEINREHLIILEVLQQQLKDFSVETPEV